jgi:hypothetical protein
MKMSNLKHLFYSFFIFLITGCKQNALPLHSAYIPKLVKKGTGISNMHLKKDMQVRFFVKECHDIN